MDAAETATVSSAVANPFEVFTLDQLRRRTSVKWRQYPHCLPLWVAEMDVALAPPITRAVVHAMDTGDTGYPFGDAYAQAFVAFAQRRWGWAVDATLTAPCSDVMTGIAAVIRTISDVNAPVIITPPVYGPFRHVVTNLGRDRVDAPLGHDGRLSLEALRSALERTRGRRPVILLSNPHNPTGVAHTREELASLVALASAFEARLVVDEIHAPLTLGDTVFTPVLSIPGAESGFSVFSASKAYNLAGLKAGLVIGGAQTGDDIRRLKQETAETTSHLGVIAHAAALNEADDWLDATLRALTQNRDTLTGLVSDHLPGARLFVPDSTYLAWIDAGALGLPPSPADFFREHAKVAFSDGTYFDPRGSHDFFRVNFATRRDILTEAFARVGAALAGRAES